MFRLRWIPIVEYLYRKLSWVNLLNRIQSDHLVV